MLLFNSFSKKEVSPPVNTKMKSSLFSSKSDIRVLTSAKIPCCTPEIIDFSVVSPLKKFSSLNDSFGNLEVNLLNDL